MSCALRAFSALSSLAALASEISSAPRGLRKAARAGTSVRWFLLMKRCAGENPSCLGSLRKACSLWRKSDILPSLAHSSRMPLTILTPLLASPLDLGLYGDEVSCKMLFSAQ